MKLELAKDLMLSLAAAQSTVSDVTPDVNSLSGDGRALDLRLGDYLGAAGRALEIDLRSQSAGFTVAIAMSPEDFVCHSRGSGCG